MQERVTANPAIQIHYNSETLDILGEEEVTGMKIINNVTKQISEIPIKAFLWL